jgi:hypothetical protein
MSSAAATRVALWASVVLNLFGAVLFLKPAMGYTSASLPLNPPAFYAAQLGMVILVFAVAYAWLATRRQFDRPLLAMGAAGKIGFFAVSLAFWWVGDLRFEQAAQATPDLVLGSIFAWHLFTTR